MLVEAAEIWPTCPTRPDLGVLGMIGPVRLNLAPEAVVEAKQHPPNSNFPGFPNISDNPTKRASARNTNSPEHRENPMCCDPGCALRQRALVRATCREKPSECLRVTLSSMSPGSNSREHAKLEGNSLKRMSITKEREMPTAGRPSSRVYVALEARVRPTLRPSGSGAGEEADSGGSKPIRWTGGGPTNSLQAELGKWPFGAIDSRLAPRAVIPMSVESAQLGATVPRRLSSMVCARRTRPASENLQGRRARTTSSSLEPVCTHAGAPRIAPALLADK